MAEYILKGELNDSILERLLAIVNDPHDSATVYISGLGGKVDCIAPFIDIANNNTAVRFILTGEVTSAGCFIAAGIRNLVMMPGAQFYWHSFGGAIPHKKGSAISEWCFEAATRSIPKERISDEVIKKMRSLTIERETHVYEKWTPPFILEQKQLYTQAQPDDWNQLENDSTKEA